VRAAHFSEDLIIDVSNVENVRGIRNPTTGWGYESRFTWRQIMGKSKNKKHNDHTFFVSVSGPELFILLKNVYDLIYQLQLM